MPIRREQHERGNDQGGSQDSRSDRQHRKWVPWPRRRVGTQ
jgi:hypothetical protein